MKNANITPRDYACHTRSAPFGARQNLHDGKPDWRKARAGLIAVTDGTEYQYVAPGLLFGVEIIDGRPVIVSYWRDWDDTTGLLAARPYTLKSIYQMVGKGQIVRRKWPLSYDDMIRMVRAVHPDAWVPDPITWYDEYCLDYDEATGEVHNPFGLCEGTVTRVKRQNGGGAT